MPSGFHRREVLSLGSGLYKSHFYRVLCLLLFAYTEAQSERSGNTITTLAVDFSPDPCPVVLGCKCINYNITNVECIGVGPDSIVQLVAKYPSLYSLRLSNWRKEYLELGLFSPLKYLKELIIIASEANKFSITSPLASVTHLVLDENMFTDGNQFCNITLNMPSLAVLSINNNRLSSVPQCFGNLAVNTLLFHRNNIVSINGTFNESTLNVDLSQNFLNSASGMHGNMRTLNFSYNPLTEANFPLFLTLEKLDLSATRFVVAPYLNSPLLTELIMDSTFMEIIDFDNWILPNLHRLSMINSFHLKYVSGRLPNTIKEFYVTNNQLASFPPTFFTGTSLSSLNLTGTNFDCDPCVMQWSVPVSALIRNQTQCSPVQYLQNCSLGISKHDPDIVRAEVGQSAILPCTTYGSSKPTIEWWLFRPVTFLGIFDPFLKDPVNSNSTCCSVLRGGALLLHNVNRSMVERYVCVAKKGSDVAYKVVHFRLDYSSWYSLDMFNSVFWGGIAMAVLVCSFSFLLNITWILTRKSVLWWIQRAERLSRVRKMVEAMEKYRAWKMENLHEKYTRRLNLVRENYHAQVEQLRLSYSSQAEKFRDYRTAQMEHMSSHLENIRENYNQQMHRVREYGARRAEQLWESYERQVNRMKAFSLQHRLKLMRQYKVKQRYLNNLLESFQHAPNPEAMRRHEQEVRAALDLIDPAGTPTDNHPLSRASSFYSLPEYIIDGNDELSPSPMIGQVRFLSRSVHDKGALNHHSPNESVAVSRKQDSDKSHAESKWDDPSSSKS